MTYQPDGWSKWTPQPREAPEWLKRMDYEASLNYDAKLKKDLLQFKPKQKEYPLDWLGLLAAFTLIMIAIVTFVGALLK
jgi:hypothetical protein